MCPINHVERACRCVFFTFNRSFYPSTSSTTSVRADSSILERYKLCGHKTTPQILHCCLVCSKQSRQCNAMSLYWIRQARHTRSMKGRKQKKQTTKKTKNKKQRKQTEREKGKTVVPPRRGCGRHLKRTS